MRIYNWCTKMDEESPIVYYICIKPEEGEPLHKSVGNDSVRSFILQGDDYEKLLNKFAEVYGKFMKSNIYEYDYDEILNMFESEPRTYIDDSRETYYLKESCNSDTK